MADYSITQYGRLLERHKFTMDFDNKIFRSGENNLVLDFPSGWTFNTDGECTFNTCSDCTFTTGRNCSFNTDNNCTFHTGSYCTFKTSNECTFETGECCVFLIYEINTCKFKSHDDISIILDRVDNQSYKLTRELINVLKINK